MRLILTFLFVCSVLLSFSQNCSSFLEKNYELNNTRYIKTRKSSIVVTSSYSYAIHFETTNNGSFATLYSDHGKPLTNSFEVIMEASNGGKKTFPLKKYINEEVALSKRKSSNDFDLSEDGLKWLATSEIRYLLLKNKYNGKMHRFPIRQDKQKSLKKIASCVFSTLHPDSEVELSPVLSESLTSSSSKSDVDLDELLAENKRLKEQVIDYQKKMSSDSDLPVLSSFSELESHYSDKMNSLEAFHQKRYRALKSEYSKKRLSKDLYDERLNTLSKDFQIQRQAIVFEKNIAVAYLSTSSHTSALNDNDNSKLIEERKVLEQQIENLRLQKTKSRQELEDFKHHVILEQKKAQLEIAEIKSKNAADTYEIMVRHHEKLSALESEINREYESKKQLLLEAQNSASSY